MKIKYCLFLFFISLSGILLAQGIDVKHISLDLHFDWQKKQAIGLEQISLSPTVATQIIYLDAAALTIHSIHKDGLALAFQYKDSLSQNQLEIFLDKEYQPSELLVLEIKYSTHHENKSDPNSIGGSFGKGLRFLQASSTTPSKRKQIWSSGEPENNQFWFPCNEEMADIHSTEITASVERPLMVISNGTLISITEKENNTRTFHYKTNTAFPNYLVSIVVGEYVDLVQKSKDISIHTFGYPDEKEAVSATTELLPDMMAFLTEKTGYSYPFEAYSQVVVQDYPFPGLVAQHSAALISDNYIDDHSVHEDFKYLWDGVAVQALANQWFANLIMPKSWDDVWLNNAFAQYFAGLYTAKSNGATEYLTYYLPFEKANILGDWNNGNRHPIVTVNHPDLQAYTSDSYSKYRGAWVLRMLQKEMGEENWWKAIRLYVSSNAGKQVSSKDFQNAVEAVTKESYQWFFDQWIYKIGMPKVSVSKEFDEQNKQLIVKVTQTQTQDTSEYQQVDFFRASIEIEIDNQIKRVKLAAQKENIFTFPLDKKPLFVNFNFEDIFLCELEFLKSKEEYLEQLAHSQDIIAKQKALDELVKIANDSSTTSGDKSLILAAFYKEINAKNYWRYRLYALASLRKISPLPYDKKVINTLKKWIKEEESWLKTSAISMLGNTKKPQYENLYLDALEDKSDRVINAAAIALGKCKSKQAYEALMKLEAQDSWKNQNRISALNGLEQLGDQRAVEYALNCLKDNSSPRWYLATPVWDYPFAAANTLRALGKADLAYPILLERFKKSLEEEDVNDIFQNVQLIDMLKDERAKEVYQLLKVKYENDLLMLETIRMYEDNFLENLR